MTKIYWGVIANGGQYLKMEDRIRGHVEAILRQERAADLQAFKEVLAKYPKEEYEHILVEGPGPLALLNWYFNNKEAGWHFIRDLPARLGANPARAIAIRRHDFQHGAKGA